MLLVEFLFNLSTKFIASLGNGQFDVLPHALFKVIGFTSELLFDIGLELLSNVLFEPEASSFIFDLESGLTLLEALAQLLFKTGPNPSAELFFTLGQQGFVPLLQATDLKFFHLNESLLHFMFEVGFYLAEALLQLLVVVQAQPLLLNAKASVVFLVKLSFNGRFHLSLSLFKPLMLLNTVLLVNGVDLTFKSQVEFLTDARLFSGQSIALHGFQFGLHGGSEFVFQRIEGEFVLGCQVLGNVGLHGLNPFADGLLTEPSLASEIGSKPLFLTEPCTRAQSLVEG